MKAIFFATLLLLFGGGQTPVKAQVGYVDLLSLLTGQPGMADRLGLFKLTAAERAAWNEVLNSVLRSANGGTIITSLAPQSAFLPPARVAVAVFEGTVDDSDGEVVQLSNGAVVEVIGYLGYFGYRRDAVLVGDGRQWRLWIEGEGTFPARLLREPSARNGRTGEMVNISEVLENGAILRLSDGRILEVDRIDLAYTDFWLGFSEAILIDGYELFNLDQGERVGITTVR